jgi:hypothetical protein
MNGFWTIPSTIMEGLKVLHILTAATNTHHKILDFVLKGSSEWMNYMYTLRLESTNFRKISQPFEKPRCQKIDIQAVHNLKFRHYLAGVAHI